MTVPRDVSGCKFGRLVAVERTQSDSRGKARWVCRCDCGETVVTSLDSLISQRVLSCGCLRREVAAEQGTKRRKHGMTGDRLFRIWSGMKQRCLNENAKGYPNYGGRGIRICEDWENNFEAFRDWAFAHGYREELTLERENTNGNYGPENCRWATMKEQQNNRRNNRLITVDGETHTISEWARLWGVPRETLAWRVKNGWPANELSMPVDLNNKNIRRFNHAQ